MLRQNLTQKQQLKINPQQLQMLELFHLTSLQLEQRIKNELEENPIIEEKENSEETEAITAKEEVQDFQDWDEYGYDDIPDYKTENKQYYQQEDMPDKPIVASRDFKIDLAEQLSAVKLSETHDSFAQFIIGNLNEKGFLETPLETLAEDFSLKTMQWIEGEEAEKILHVIQQCEPAGVGARDIRECMMLQLKRMNTKCPDVKAALTILERFYDDLKARNFEKIEHALQIDEEELRMVLEMMGTLNLNPVGSAEEKSTADTIIPDFIITHRDDGMEVRLANQRSANLVISNRMKAMVKEAEKGKDTRTFQYLKSKLNSAEWFVNAIRQRETTMLNVINAIVQYQFDYFQDGDKSMLRPMILKNIAELAGVDISTVSRITCNKYVQTPFGTILLKSLFSEGIENKNGAVISNKVIQKEIEEVIKCEDKKSPYSDQQLASLLATRGFNIARRTVTKYREHLQIPVAQMRAFWA
ncbi:RNA polymerase factor sigma-54 [Ohtaekwangia sp.]|uniref:RNA polymerase factor sigma-54 n=1 Tax=Ohtaekwangia sp. TaxID=2066019 RepID=UPI002FDC8090